MAQPIFGIIIASYSLLSCRKIWTESPSFESWMISGERSLLSARGLLQLYLKRSESMDFQSWSIGTTCKSQATWCCQTMQSMVISWLRLPWWALKGQKLACSSTPCLICMQLLFRGGSYTQLVLDTYAKKQSSPEAPWKLVIYSDEIDAGDPLAPRWHTRKVWAFCFSFLEFGSIVLSK